MSEFLAPGQLFQEYTSQLNLIEATKERVGAGIVGIFLVGPSKNPVSRLFSHFVGRVLGRFELPDIK